MSKYQIPFSAGMHGELDPAMLPHGALSSIEGGRLPRDGGIVKARGTVTGDTTVTSTSAAIAEPIDGFSEFSGREWLSANGRVYARGEGSGDSWQEVGRTPRYFPVRERWAQFDDTRSTSSTSLRGACATTGGFIATTWASTDASDYNAFLRITRASGESVAFHVATARYITQVIAVGAYFVWAYQKSDNSNIYARRYDPATDTLGSEVTLAAIALTSDRWRIAVHSSTQWLFWRRQSTTTIGYSLRGITASLVEAADDSTSCNNQVVLDIRSLSTANAVYLVYADDTGTIGGDCFFVAWPADLGTGPTGSAEITAATDDVLEFGLIERDATTAWAVCTTYSTGTQHALEVIQLNASGSISDPFSPLRMVKLASRPFYANTTELRTWLRIDNSVDATANIYALVTLQLTAPLVMQPELVPDPRCPAGFVEPTEVLTLGNSLFFLASAVVRSGLRSGTPSGGFSGGSGGSVGVAETAAALVFYEFEEASHPRMMAGAGSGYCFGGAGLVLPSDRTGDRVGDIASGTEDGFLRRPECTMAVSAGAGLTSGALYQGFVVFERIDTDIRRIRSAPSSLLTATPSGGNLRLTLTIMSHPITEGEVSSGSHATAAHVYLTAANGSIFYRITPDDGAPLAAPSNMSSFTYVVTAEPATTKELLYTLGNAIPNAPAPAHRYGFVAAGRGWAMGLFDPRIVECTKLMVPNEPLTWTRHPAFRAFAPLDVTCGSEIDGSIVLLGPDGIALMPASTGPNNQGQPALPTPVLVSRVGCVRPESLLRSPNGLLYEGTRGIYIMPRGGGEPEYLGAGMMDEIAHVNSAALVYVAPEADRLPQVLAAFAYETIFGVRKVAFLDPEARRWVGFDGRECSTLGVFGSLLVSDSPGGDEITSDATTQATGSNASTVVTTGHIYPFGPLGNGEITKCQLLFTVKQLGVTLSCAMSIDGQEFEDARPVLLPANLPDNTPMVTGQLHAVEWSVHPERGGRNLSSIRFRFSDAAEIAGDGVIFHGCALEGKAADGLRKLPRALRSA